MGFSQDEALIAGGVSALIGTICGGAGSQVTSSLLKHAVSQAAADAAGDLA